MKKSMLAAVMAALMFLSACSTAWISQAQAVVAVLLPAAVNIIQLVALLENKTISPNDVNIVTRYANQANADFALVKTLLDQYNAANAQTTLQKVDAALNDAQANLASILPAVHISDQNTVAKLQAVVGIVVAEVQSLEAIIPIVKAGPATAARPMGSKSFKGAFNRTMHAPSGSPVVDSATATLGLK